jgi:putative exosortase-associated protein (TIGR04073 family)
MSKFFRISVLLGLLLTIGGPVSAAQGYGIPPQGAQAYGGKAPPQPSYGDKVLQKLGWGFTNMALGWLEIPKNTILTVNQTNLLFGVIGGPVKGALHTAGRTLCGVLDLLTAPLPTEPIAKPTFIWQDFQTETQYGNLFQTKK